MVCQGDVVVLVSTHSHPGDPAWLRHDCHPSSELTFLCCLLQGWSIISGGCADFGTPYSFCIEQVGISSGALGPLFHLTPVVARRDWHSGKCWRLQILVYIEALVTAVLRGTALILATVGEPGMTMLVQMWGREKGERLKEAEGGERQVVRPCAILRLGFLQT